MNNIDLNSYFYWSQQSFLKKFIFVLPDEI